jgi:hypothetical protein
MTDAVFSSDVTLDEDCNLHRSFYFVQPPDHMDDGLLFFLPHTWTMASSSFLPLNAVSKQQLTSALKLEGSFFCVNRPPTHGSWPSFGARTNF